MCFNTLWLGTRGSQNLAPYLPVIAANVNASDGELGSRGVRIWILQSTAGVVLSYIWGKRPLNHGGADVDVRKTLSARVYCTSQGLI